jgi:hypothetical protein
MPDFAFRIKAPFYDFAGAGERQALLVRAAKNCFA